jgi:hypothetical protein
MTLCLSSPARAATGFGMSLNAAHGEQAIVGPDVDAVSSSTPLTGTQSFWAKLDNRTPAAVTNPTVRFDSGYPPAGFFANSGPVTAFPVMLSAPSIPAGADGLFLGMSSPIAVTGAPGFDSNRSVDRLEIPLGGGAQTTTFSFTLTDPRYATNPAHYAKLSVNSPVPGATLVALLPPAPAGGGDFIDLFRGANGGTFVLHSGIVGHTYVFSVVLSIPNPFGAVFAHKPGVNLLSVIDSTPVCFACGPQISASLPEPLLDGPGSGSGRVSASIDQALTWQTGYSDTFGLQYDPTPLPPPCSQNSQADQNQVQNSQGCANP